jgi:exodeoxyribonuclease VII large subunit
MSSIMMRSLQNLNGKWERLVAELDNLSPLNILKKGYTLCWKNDASKPVQMVEAIDPGDEVTVTFFKGEFTAQVSRIDSNRSIESRLKKKEQ